MQKRKPLIQRRLAGLLITFLAGMPALAEEPVSPEKARQIVKQVETPYMDALTGGRVDEAAALFTKNATVESEWGAVRKGRDVIREKLRRDIEPHEAERTWSSRITVATGVTPDVLVTHGVTFIVSGGGVIERLYHTRVLQRTDEGWRIAAEHLARPSTLPRNKTIAD